MNRTKTHLSLLLLTAGLLAASCTEGGGSGGGGDPAGSVSIKNLTVTVDKASQEIRLTMAIENGTGQAIASCASGTVEASTGESAPIAVQGGSCDGFIPEGIGGGAPTMPGFCAQDDLYSVCQSGGLAANSSTGVATLSGQSYDATLQAWEQPGTEYTVTIQFLLEDATPVEATATATIQ